MVLDAKAAIARHMRWRMTLRFAVATREPLSPEESKEIVNYRTCAIGRWLDDPSAAKAYDAAEWQDLSRKHIAFHAEMAKIAAMLSRGEFEAAEAAMDLSSPFQAASNTLAMAITNLDHRKALAVPA